eukprot:TRINITY_DN2265_c0_g2_i2.p1 TRINITY_DN2265_c0_g2~~TRINITY_DN2265_c0_g2_i2.p1  ORF type:complete len:237 (-),score=74.51 TRINITY_DN2265_c0_g2_i2:163-873(-)
MGRQYGLLAGVFAAVIVLVALGTFTAGFVPSGKAALRASAMTAAGTAVAGAATPAFAAEEAKAAAEGGFLNLGKIELGGGFAINLDIPETGLVNIIVLVAGLFYLLSPLLSESMASREKEIQSDIDDAIAKYNEATARLAEAEKAKAQADQVVKEINDTIVKDLAETEQKLKESARLAMEKQERIAASNLEDMKRAATEKVESYINEQSVMRGLKELSAMDAGKKTKYMKIAISSL